MKCFNCLQETTKNVCEHCNTVQHFRYAVLVIFGSALVVAILIFSSCALHKYGYRQHRNRVAQKVIQYEQSDPKRAHANAQYRHFSERPKNHWPLND